MISATFPIVSPLRSATGLLSSRDRRSVILLSAAAPDPGAVGGPGVGVVVMGRPLLARTVNVFLSEPVIITVPSASILDQAGERTVTG